MPNNAKDFHFQQQELDLFLIQVFYDCKQDIENENPWHCWACDIKGKSIKSLFNTVKVESNKYSELNSILGTTYKTDKVEIEKPVELPKEYKLLFNLNKSDIAARQALMYLKNRDIKI